jgi:hypothetical protein
MNGVQAWQGCGSVSGFVGPGTTSYATADVFPAWLVMPCTIGTSVWPVQIQWLPTDTKIW